MPIEIRELVFKATIVPEGTANQTSAAVASINHNVNANEEIINTCVEKVLEIIKDKNGR
jgi:hypothetical protein